MTGSHSPAVEHKKTFVRLILSLLLVVFPAVASLAQERIGTVTGEVTTTTGEALVNAVVLFTSSQDSTHCFPAVCDEQGRFYQELPLGAYSYRVSYLGASYTPERNQVEVSKRSTSSLSIVITPSAQALEEVVVVAKRPFVSYDGGVARYNLLANPAAIGGNLLDGLKLIPGVQLEERGGLSVYGFYTLTVAVNGRILRLSPEDVQAYLSSLSVEDTERVELIRHPGPEYGVQSGAVLNIVTKGNPREGLNAFISADASYRREISEVGRLRLNYYNKDNKRSYIAYQIFDNRRLESLTTTLGADTTSTSPHRGQAMQAGFEWQISPQQLFDIRLHGSLSDEHIDYSRGYHTDMRRMVGAVNLYHSLSADRWVWNSYADYTFSGNHRSYSHSDSELQDQYHYLRLSTNYTYRFSPSLLGLLGVTQNNIWFATQAPTASSGVNERYYESNSSAYVTLRYHKGALDSYGGVQLNYDHRTSQAQGTRLLSDQAVRWQPYLNVDYDIARNHRLALSLQTYYQRPALRDLMPYASYAGFLYRVGNDRLQSSMRHNLALNYSYRRAAMLEVNLSNEQHPIVEYLTPYQGAYAITKGNLDYSRYLRIVAGAPIPIIYRDNGLQWIATTYLAWHLQRDRGTIDGSECDRTFHAYYLQHKQSLNLPAQWYLDAQVTYYSPLFVGVYKTQSQWWINLSISKRIASWKLSLSCYDLLNSNVARGEIMGLSQPIAFVQNWYSPKVTFSISCTLGNKRLKSSSRQTINSESRLTDSANEGLSFSKP